MDIRFVSRDGDDLVFESDAGDRFVAPIDDSLKDSLKTNPRVISVDFSPKYVQDQIRAGLSVEQVAAELNVLASSIEPFAVPILDELRFVLQAALDTQVNDGSHMRRFEELVLNAVPGAEFRAVKRDGAWSIEVDGEQGLTWRFDQRSRHIEPTSPEAERLARAHSSRDIISTPQSIPAQATKVAAEPESDDPSVAHEPEAATASVHSLVEELRSRRKQDEIKPATAKGRASLPSWDEIVLGATKSESDTD